MNLIIHPSLSAAITILTFENTAWNVKFWETVGKPDATDAEILAFAAAHGSVIVTAELGFKNILTASPERTPSILQIRCENIHADTIPSSILAALAQMEADLLAGCLITLSIKPEDNSLRRLPIGPRTAPDTASESLTFRRDAFLSATIFDKIPLSEPLQQLASLAISINRLSVMRLQDVVILEADGRAITSALLLSQATTGFEASCILAATGMEGEARAQARNCLEAGIVCYTLAMKPELDIIARLNGARKHHYKNGSAR